MFAVIQTGGKQYKVSPHEKVEIEKLPQQEGEKVVFDQVLLIEDDAGKHTVGAPYVPGAKVTGTLASQMREAKKIVFKYHSKTRYRKTKGHRQPKSVVTIESIDM